MVTLFRAGIGECRLLEECNAADYNSFQNLAKASLEPELDEE